MDLIREVKICLLALSLQFLCLMLYEAVMEHNTCRLCFLQADKEDHFTLFAITRLHPSVQKVTAVSWCLALSTASTCLTAWH